MSRSLFSFIIIISLITGFVLLFSNFEFSSESFAFGFSILVFIITTKNYEKKNRFVSPGYLFYAIVIFFVYNVSAYRYTYRVIGATFMMRNQGAVAPVERYLMYFFVFLICSVLINFYLSFKKSFVSASDNLVLRSSNSSALGMIFVAFPVLFPLHLYAGEALITASVPFVTYFLFCKLVKIKGVNKCVQNLGFILSLLMLIPIVTRRFVLLQFALPVIIAWIIARSDVSGSKRGGNWLHFGVFIAFIILLLVYGGISEMIKLNLFYGKNYTLSQILDVALNPDTFCFWADRQLFRVFDIWIILGGNIIDFADRNGLYLGATYLKTIFKFAGLDYIDLPAISANLIGANYAQPGLMAEGYANFSLLGAIINLLIPFFVAEYFLYRLLVKRSVLSMLLLVTPFSKIILDGGSVNSAIFMIIMCILSFSFGNCLRSMSIKSHPCYSLKSGT